MASMTIESPDAPDALKTFGVGADRFGRVALRRAESVVNLVAALFVLVIVHWAAQPPDEDHPYGHEKADYLSAGVEGSLILLAALTIAFSAIGRLLDPQPISDVGIGLSVSVVASAINLVVARKLIAAGREHRSLVLECDGRYLMTDVWTSVGVVMASGSSP
jgi:cation diffusion facilitator family transporter